MNKNLYKYSSLSFLIFLSNIYAGWNFSTQDSTLSILGSATLTLESSITGFDGTLHVKDNTAGTIVPSGSETITFDGGVLKTGETSSGLVVTSKLTGVFDPATTDSIDLQADDYIDVSAGTVLQAVTVDSGAAGSITASIYGEPKFSSAITLGAATDTLQLGITSSLNQDVTGSGTLRLLNDLAVDYNVQIEPNVDLDGKRLILGGGTYNDALTFSSTDGDGIIEFTHMINLEEAWTITATTCTINGNGNTIDLSNASAQLVGNGTTLTLSNMHIVGLSGTKLSGTGEIRFCNCTLSLTGNYTKSAGGDLTFYCDNSKVITNGSTFVVDTTPEINVDGVVLFYEQLDGSGNSPFTGSTTNLTNGGVIRSTVPVGSPSVTTGAASYTLGDNYNLSSNTTITFSNAGSVTVDGNGQFISLPCQAGTYLDVSTPTDVTFSDIVFKDFNPESINGMDAVRFGDDVYIELGKDLTIESADDAWVCTGNVTIDGNGHTLRVEKASGITIGSSSLAPRTLTLKNVRLETSVVDGITCDSDNDHIKLESMDFVMEDAGFTLTQGNMEIHGFVSLTGKHSSNTPPTVTFELNADPASNEMSSMIIKSGSTLFVDKFVELKQDSADAGYKHRIFFEESSSELFLNGCILDAGTEGMVLHGGTLVVQDKVTLEIAASKPIELSETMNVYVLAGADMDVQGPLEYKAQTQFSFDDKVRLRHMNTGAYLAASDAGNLGEVFAYHTTTPGHTGAVIDFEFNGSGSVVSGNSSDVLLDGFTDELVAATGTNAPSVAGVTENVNPPYASWDVVTTTNGQPHVFTRVAGSGAIYYGDLVTILENNDNTYYSSDGYEYTLDGVTDTQEVYAYDNTGAAPGRNAHYWYIERVGAQD